MDPVDAKVFGFISTEADVTHVNLFGHDDEPEPTPKAPAEIREDPRNLIQRMADKAYADPDIGGLLASIADVLPGIPFVDIIDPPDRLVSEGQESLRNLAMAVDLGLGLKGLPKAIGRIATNIKTPVNYGFTRKLTDINPLKAVKSVIKDKPYWDNPGSRIDNVLSAREVPYRMMFGLKPRSGTSIYKFKDNNVIEFDKNNVLGSQFRKSVMDDIREAQIENSLEMPARTMSKNHSVMGGYNLKYDPKTKDWIYEDVWDFDINKGEVLDVLDEMKNRYTSGIGGPSKSQILETAALSLRKAVGSITDPVTIRGRISDDEMRAYWDLTGFLDDYPGYKSSLKLFNIKTVK